MAAPEDQNNNHLETISCATRKSPGSTVMEILSTVMPGMIGKVENGSHKSNRDLHWPVDSFCRSCATSGDVVCCDKKYP